MDHIETQGTPTSDAALARVRRAGAWLAASLSMGAAVIHLAAGGEHIEALGDLGLGFYWAATFQAVTALALLGRSDRPWVTSITIAGNTAILAAWVLSRTLGLPTVPGGPESIGLADGVAAALQILLVGFLLVRDRVLDARWMARRSPDRLGSRLLAGLGTAMATIALSTFLAVGAVAAAQGDGHGTVGGAGHEGVAPGIAEDAGHGHGALIAP